MTRCGRCFKETGCLTGSYYDTKMICLDCDQAERQRPDFDQAVEADNAAIRAGDYNSPGYNQTR